MTRPTTWRKSTHSGHDGGDCVEVASGGAVALARDSKNPDGPVLRFDPDEWRAFLSSIKAGRLDPH